jgi:hypothetical protein
MIESSMYFGIGLLFGALIGLVLIPLVHARAVRLTTRRLEAVLPESMAEVQAERICSARTLQCRCGASR